MARWFFCGSSCRSAEEILGPALLSAVQKQLIVSDQNFYVHKVLSTHVSEEHGRMVEAHVVEDMVATKSMMRVKVEVHSSRSRPTSQRGRFDWAAQNLPQNTRCIVLVSEALKHYLFLIQTRKKYIRSTCQPWTYRLTPHSNLP